ncbi:MAG: response regulator, partial [Victivallales bacterium]|nr:response regulator [Victivallales bacterium]
MAGNMDNGEIYFKPAANIVLVDDSELNRDFIRMAFKKPNYQVYTASDGLEGIELIHKLQPELILLDIMMPGLDGYDVAAVLKEDPKTTNIPIIFITALNDIQDKLKAFDAGAVDFVSKPFNHRELIARVKTNIENRRLVLQKDNMMQVVMRDKRNSAIARIAGGISHNINNMLSTAFGNLNLLESLLQDKLDETSRDAFNDVQLSLSKIQLLAKRFLVLSGHQSPGWIRPENRLELDLRLVVEEFIENNQEQERRVRVIYKNNIAERLMVVYDSNLIIECLQLITQELLDTAREYVLFHFSGARDDQGNPYLELAIESD